MQIEKNLKSFEDIHSYIMGLEYRTTIFRGVRKDSYELITSVGRKEFRENLQKSERRMFKLFMETSLPHLDFVPRNCFEWLAVAQHYGLPTRLLDWTYNPLVALYFAVEKEGTSDSALYIYDSDNVVNTETESDPFGVTEVQRYRPPYISNRIISQSGVFTIHPNPDVIFDDDKIIKIIIPNGGRRRLKQMLYKYGINRKTLFPGLEGIATDIMWLNTDTY